MARTNLLEEDDEQKPGSSIKSVVIGVLMSIIIGGASGFGFGYFLGAPTSKSEALNETGPAAEPAAEEIETAESHAPNAKSDDVHSAAKEDGDKPGSGEDEIKVDPVINQLDPIVTNLLDPSSVWIRLELALTSEQPLAPDLSSQIHQDLFAHVRAMRLVEMAGPSAFIDLKAELLARARLRSENLVQNLYVKTLLYE